MNTPFPKVVWLLVFGITMWAYATGLEDFAWTSYFEAHCATNDEDSLVKCWRLWVQNYRAVLKHPKLAHKLLLRRPKVHLECEDILPGLSQKQVRCEPSDIYTLQIAAFEKIVNAQRFLQVYWKGMESRHIYACVPKGFVIECGCARSNGKDDPLYSMWESRKGKRLLCVRYGIYATREDAKKDKRVLERLLGRKLILLRRPITKNLIKRVWHEPVAGQWINECHPIGD